MPLLALRSSDLVIGAAIMLSYRSHEPSASRAQMSSVGYFWYLASGTAEFLAHFGFVTFPIFVAAVSIVGWASRRITADRRRILIAFTAPAAIPVILLILGVAFVRPEFTAWADGVHPPVPWFKDVPVANLEAAIWALLVLHIPLGAGLGWWARHGWPAALAGTMWWGWVSFCVGRMAQMSVTGIWL
jgi:hypothetical protein